MHYEREGKGIVMNGRNLLDAMEYISDDLIEEAAEGVQKKSRRKFRWQRWVAAAAGIVVLCVSAVTLNEWIYMNSNKSSSSNTNNSSARDTSTSDTTSGGMNFSSSSIDNETYLENAYEEIEQEEAAGEINQSAPLTSADTESSSQSSIKNETSKQGNIFIIEDFPPKYPYREPSEDLLTESSYVSPRKGTCFYSQKLTEALAYYDSEQTDSTVTTENAEKPYNVYHVVIKLFSDREESGNVIYGEIELHENSELLLKEEYERLSEKGYDVSLSEDYELKGFFTKSELETFDALSEYGYIFSLVSE